MDENLSVIKPRGESQWVLQENKVGQIFQKTIMCYPLIRTCAKIRKFTKIRKFGRLCFLGTPVLRFALLSPTADELFKIYFMRVRSAKMIYRYINADLKFSLCLC